MASDKTWLSHSGIEILERCPRCFWLRYNKKIYQPEGIVSRLPGRFDIIIKRYFDKYREKGQLPPIIEEKMEGVLENPFQEKYWHTINEKYGFWGKLDDCLINPKGQYIPIDFKTSSSDPKNREVFPAYQNQLDQFSFLLEKNKKKTAGIGYLIYFYPKESDELHNGFPMDISIQELKVDIKGVAPKLEKIIKILEGDMPEPSKECSFCSWFGSMKVILKKG